MSHDSHSRPSSYNGHITDEVSQVRHLIGDVYDSFTFLSDPEIQFALDNNNDNPWKAGADCCRAIAARVARNTDYRFSTLWQDSSQAYKHFMELAGTLESEASRKSKIVLMKDNTEAEDPVFSIGMTDHGST